MHLFLLLILSEGAANGKLEEAIISLASLPCKKVAGLAGPLISDGEIKEGGEGEGKGGREGGLISAVEGE